MTKRTAAKGPAVLDEHRADARARALRSRRRSQEGGTVFAAAEDWSVESPEPYASQRRQRMATRQSSQKFIARNRAPRVQIEYDVELYGAQKKVQIPFVMGVMSDLSGANAGDLPPVEERKALEIDVDNF